MADIFTKQVYVEKI